MRRFLPPQFLRRKPLPPQQPKTLLSWPTPPKYRIGSITQYFNTVYPNTAYFAAKGVAGKKHGALDIVLPVGQEIRASCDMVILQAIEDFDAGGYGELIIGQSGNLVIYYAHNSRLLVEKGQKVKRGDLIAYSGNSGISTAPHTHFEVRRDGVKIDPLPLLPK